MRKQSVVRVGLVQMMCSDDPRENLERGIQLTEQAADEGAEIVCLPELFQTRYFCQVEDRNNFQFAEPVPGPTTERFADLARRKNITVIVSLFERRAAGVFHNTAAVIDGSSGYLGKYRKMHIPDDPRYFEKYYFTPGDLGFRMFSTRRADIGVQVCWDQWYPEGARATALEGAEILFYPTAIGGHPEEGMAVAARQREMWELIQRSHAVANGCYVVAVNRAGFEPEPQNEEEGPERGIHFWGQSFVAAPDGEVVWRAPEEKESVAVVALDLGQVDEMRIGWPFFRDRRIDAYSSLLQRMAHKEE